jgi:hypothetical protein
MDRLLLVLLFLMLVVGVPVARVTRRLCQRSPGYRSGVVAVAVVLLIVVAIASTQLDRVIPDSKRESPAGLFPLFGAAFVLAVVAISAFSLIAGVILSRRSTAGSP